MLRTSSLLRYQQQTAETLDSASSPLESSCSSQGFHSGFIPSSAIRGFEVPEEAALDEDAKNYMCPCPPQIWKQELNCLWARGVCYLVSREN